MKLIDITTYTEVNFISISKSGCYVQCRNNNGMPFFASINKVCTLKEYSEIRGLIPDITNGFGLSVFIQATYPAINAYLNSENRVKILVEELISISN
jgi:hypothetical protein